MIRLMISRVSLEILIHIKIYFIITFQDTEQNNHLTPDMFTGCLQYKTNHLKFTKYFGHYTNLSFT